MYRLPQNEFGDYKPAIDHLSSDYTILSKLGEGNFGLVVKGFHRLLEKEQAIKIIDISNMGEEQKTLILREIKLSRACKHKHILKIKNAYDREGWLYIMTNVCATDLDKLYRSTALNTIQILTYMIEISEAVSYIHSAGIIHRDLKPGNILMENSDRKLITKIGDFGLAKSISNNLRSTSSHKFGIFHTPGFSAPEYVQPRNKIDRDYISVDNWSIGVILYLLLEKRLPFPVETPGLMFTFEYVPLSEKNREFEALFKSIFFQKEHRFDAKRIKKELQNILKKEVPDTLPLCPIFGQDKNEEIKMNINESKNVANKMAKSTKDPEFIQIKGEIIAQICTWCKERIPSEGIRSECELKCGHRYHIKCLKDILDMADKEDKVSCTALNCTYIVNMREKQNIISQVDKLTQKFAEREYRDINLDSCGICKKRIGDEETELIKLQCQHHIHKKCLKENSLNKFMFCIVCKISLSAEDQKRIETIRNTKFEGNKVDADSIHKRKDKLCQICMYIIRYRPFLMFSCSHYFHHHCLQMYSPNPIKQCPSCHFSLNSKDIKYLSLIISTEEEKDVNTPNTPNTPNTDKKCTLCNEPARNKQEYLELGCTHRIHVQCIKNADKLLTFCPARSCLYFLPKETTFKLKMIRGQSKKTPIITSPQELNNSKEEKKTPRLAPTDTIITDFYAASEDICIKCEKLIHLNEPSLKLSHCSHIFHLNCIRQNLGIYSKVFKIKNSYPLCCPFPCGRQMTEDEMQQLFESQLPIKSPRYQKMSYGIQILCKLCNKYIENITDELCNLPCGHKYHKKCIFEYLVEKTQGKILLIKQEEGQYPRKCPFCPNRLTNEIIIKYILRQVIVSKLKKQMEQRENERIEEVRQEREKSGMIELRCCKTKVEQELFEILLHERIKENNNSLIQGSGVSEVLQLIPCLNCEEIMNAEDLMYLLGKPIYVKEIRKLCSICGKEVLFEQSKGINCSVHKMCKYCKIFSKDKEIECKLCYFENMIPKQIIKPNIITPKTISFPSPASIIPQTLKNQNMLDPALARSISIPCCACRAMISINTSIALNCGHSICQLHVLANNMAYCSKCRKTQFIMKFCECGPPYIGVLTDYLQRGKLTNKFGKSI